MTAITIGTYCKGAMLDGPDCAAMIGVRVVGWMLRRKSPNAPAGEHVVCEQSPQGTLDERLIGNAGRDAMQSIGTNGIHLALIRVEGHGEEALIFIPEHLIKAFSQLLRLVVEPLGILLAVKPPQDCREI